MKNNKIIKLLIIFVIVICLILVIISLIPNKKGNINASLNEQQTVELFKRVRRTLLNSQGLEGNKFTDDVMIRFAFDYMVATGKDNIRYDEQQGVVILNRNDVIDVVRYVFNKEISFNNVEHKFDDNYIYINLIEHSTDAQIYKFKEEILNLDGTYTIYIDCLEANANMYSELSKNSVTKYDEADVMMTLAFKYKTVGERKVLLAYECDTKWW